jgi:hypothetical protein
LRIETPGQMLAGLAALGVTAGVPLTFGAEALTAAPVLLSVYVLEVCPFLACLLSLGFCLLWTTTACISLLARLPACLQCLRLSYGIVDNTSHRGCLAAAAAQGIGRAVFEGTNRAVFADWFRPPHVEGAFSCWIVQSGGSAALAFLALAVGPAWTSTAVGVLALLVATLAAPAFVVGERGVRREQLALAQPAAAARRSQLRLQLPQGLHRADAAAGVTKASSGAAAATTADGSLSRGSKYEPLVGSHRP